jgi:hypothetical protein
VCFLFPLLSREAAAAPTGTISGGKTEELGYLALQAGELADASRAEFLDALVDFAVTPFQCTPKPCLD